MPLPYFPGPDPVLQGMIDDRDLLLESTYHSLRLLLSGYAAGVAAGLVSGVLIGWFAPGPLLGDAGAEGRRPDPGDGLHPAGDGAVPERVRLGVRR